MQITNSLLSSISNDLGFGQTASKAASRQGSQGEDQVQISTLASQLSSDPSKLSQLQAAYESGTYNVSPSQIANSILNDAMVK
jgi:anti-sigma28 factor (negative regulator of flagellin synthesis)